VILLPQRLIPVLLIDRDMRVVKTVGFGERTYIGDPFNIIRLFNEKEVDEICVLDIDATADRRGPRVEFIEALAAECFMPLAYGGGLSEISGVRQLARGGVEKFVVRSAATEPFVRALADEFGSQAVVGCIDYRSTAEGRRTLPRAGAFAVDPGVRADELVEAGAGELILQSVDHDGRRTGMDLAGIADLAPRVSVPLIALGGAGAIGHMEAAIDAGAAAAASGSAFSFIGRLRAVLITYPAFAERQAGLAR